MLPTPATIPEHEHPAQITLGITCPTPAQLRAYLVRNGWSPFGAAELTWMREQGDSVVYLRDVPVASTGADPTQYLTRLADVLQQIEVVVGERPRMVLEATLR